MQGARNGRGGKAHYIHLPLKLLNLFFVIDAEALLLVNNQQAQILEANIRREQAMCADDNINLALLQLGHRLFLLRVGNKSTEQANVDGKLLHSRQEGVIVLLS